MSRTGFNALFSFKDMTAQKAITLVFVGSVILVVVSYGIWQFGRLLSPSLTINNSDPVVSLKVTNYSLGHVPLPNNLTDTTFPNFSDNTSTPTALTFGADGRLDMARLEIRVDYR